MRQAGQNRVTLDSVNGNFHVGGNGAKGDLFVYSNSVAEPFADNTDGSKASIHLDGRDSGRIVVRNRFPQPDSTLVFKDVIVLDGNTGDISLDNADCAEEFDIAQSEEIVPGTVMVLGPEGRLQQSKEAYDRKVAGVISGAGDCKPGIVLDKKHSQLDRMPVALVGKVYCKADAQYSPIEVGDLLTTSYTPGHAMKADDPFKAFGAVIGKALCPLQTGQALIPILIALQ